MKKIIYLTLLLILFEFSISSKKNSLYTNIGGCGQISYSSSTIQVGESIIIYLPNIFNFAKQYYYIQWGDGTTEYGNSKNNKNYPTNFLQHTYYSSGVYEIYLYLYQLDPLQQVNCYSYYYIDYIFVDSSSYSNIIGGPYISPSLYSNGIYMITIFQSNYFNYVYGGFECLFCNYYQDVFGSNGFYFAIGSYSSYIGSSYEAYTQIVDSDYDPTNYYQYDHSEKYYGPSNLQAQYTLTLGDFKNIKISTVNVLVVFVSYNFGEQIKCQIKNGNVASCPPPSNISSPTYKILASFQFISSYSSESQIGYSQIIVCGQNNRCGGAYAGGGLPPK